jgi:hypothetical protein
VGQTFLSAECSTASCGRQEYLPHRFICRHQAITCHHFAVPAQMQPLSRESGYHPFAFPIYTEGRPLSASILMP